MKGKYLRVLTRLALCCVLIFAVAALTGCSGDTGDTGPQGPPGPPGPAAEGGLTLQDLANLGLVYSSDVTPINPKLDLSKTVSYDSATGNVTVHFFLTDGSGNGIDLTTMPYDLRFLMSDLVPAAEKADPTDNPGPYWEQDASDSGNTVTGGLPGKLTAVDTSTGEYNYTFGEPMKATDHVVRVTVIAVFRFRDNNNNYVYVANPVNASYDFLESDPGTPLASSGAELVTVQACQQCHGGQLKDADHGRYTDPKTCNNCHNIQYMASHTEEADLAYMIHAIHSSRNFDVGDFSEVTYPQDTDARLYFRCVTCHNGANANLITVDISRANCGSCHAHSDIDFATGAGHPGGPQANDAACTGCHSQGGIGLGVAQAHDISNLIPPSDVPEFDIQITMTPPANGQFYVAGEAPMVTVTLTDHATGQPVDPSVYTSPKDAAGNAGGGLSLANLYVYGPRDGSPTVPVLTTGSTTDTVTPATPPTQGHALFVGGSDPLVKTDATGFHYQLLPIPASMTIGTYMVQFQGQDYGAVSATNFVTTSSYKINFQVGTADVQHKRSGDACLECHDGGRMHLEGSHAHNIPFDTDYCLACHDESGGHGDYIGNRVHAVHSASATGDFVTETTATGDFPRNWIEVTFPQSVNNCVICHTNPDAPVPQQIYMLACGGCHGTHPDADPSAVVAASEAANPDVDEAAELAKVQNEVSAAQHMVQNGGDAAADDQGLPHTLACLTCHAPGRTADITKVHNLNIFPPEPTPQP